MSGVATWVLVFIIGLVLGIRLLAALYGVVDQWYAIRTAWPVVLRRIMLWSVLVAVVWLVSGRHRMVFLLGMGAHLLMHVASWHLIVRSFPKEPKPSPIVE